MAFSRTKTKEGMPEVGGSPPPPQILADQLNLSQPGGHIMPTTLLRAPPPPDFETFLRLWKEGMHLQQVAWPRQLHTF